MGKIDTWGLTCSMNNELRQHDYLTLIPSLFRYAEVSNEEIYDALLNPDKSPYINTSYRTILQANATLVFIMLYAVYCGYLYSAIRSDASYDRSIWTYDYMHRRLDANIYEPFFVALLPKVLDYEMSSSLKQLYIGDSRNVFLIALRYIGAAVTASGLKNINIYENADRNSSFYKTELPDVLNAMHQQGMMIFFDSDKTRLKGKNLLSANFWEGFDI